MNRKLLFLGVSLSIIAVVFSIAIQFIIGASSDVSKNFAFHNALQIHFFHTLVIFFLATVKRKYTDQNLIIAGWLFGFSILLFSVPAYIGMFSKTGIVLFNTVGLVGSLGFIIGWILLLKTFYDMFLSKDR